MPSPESSLKQLILADWIAPMNGPILRDAGVVFERGQVGDLGSRKTLRAAHPDAVETDLGGCVLLPGLINSHVHLDLTHATRPDYPGSFVEWVKGVIRDGIAKGADPAPWIDATRDGFAECLRFGVTAVGDIGGRFPREVRAALASDPTPRPRWTSFGEVTAMGQRRGLLEERLAIAVNGPPTDDRFRIGVSPHAPYSIEPAGYRRCLEIAIQRGLPLTTHLAETPDEAPFLEAATGPFRDLWTFLNAWDDCVPTFVGGPIRYAQSLGLLDFPALLAHVNYCDDDELALLAGGEASVVYCPRTHRYFGHPPHRFRDMLDAGINVVLGTDSRASAPDLNLVDDLRLLHVLAPDFPVAELWRMVTVRAADGTGMRNLGSFQPGNFADAVAFPVAGGEALREVLETNVLPCAVWIAGQPVPL